jgi:endoglucanase
MTSLRCPACDHLFDDRSSNTQRTCANCGGGPFPALTTTAAVDSEPANGTTANSSNGLHEPEQLPTPNEAAQLLAPTGESDDLSNLGPYRILKVLGAGGMGMVYQAEDTLLKREVALKVMLPALSAVASSRKRFLREAQTAAALAHDHIVQIFQVGEANSRPFIAMQLLHGESLETRLQKQRPLPIPEVVRIGTEVARGLAAAHARGVIHRDIKPANLWLEADKGRVKILDFGLARAVDDAAQITREGAIIGTPAYMAPEQASGSTVDHRSDLFSLGCVLYVLSTGELPFRGPDGIATLVAVRTVDPPSPRSLQPQVPRALSDLVMKLLAKDPRNRPASAQEVADILESLNTNPTLTGDSLRWPPPVPPRQRFRSTLMAIVAAVVLIGPFAIWFAVAVRHSGRVAEATTNTQGPATKTAVAVSDIYAANKKLGRAVNFSGYLEAPRDQTWGTLEAEYFQAIKAAGFDSVRLLINWPAHADADAPYAIDAAFAAKVDWAVDQARANRLNIVINVHAYVEIYNDPEGESPRLVRIWEQIAERYKNRDDGVYFELLDEPINALNEHKWNALIPRLLAVVRKTNPTRPVIVGSGLKNSVQGLDSLVLPSDDRNLIVTFHIVDPKQFTSQGMPWDPESEKWVGTKWVGSEAEQAAIRKPLATAAAWAKQHDRPIFLGEFGCSFEADSESRARYAGFIALEAERLNFSWGYWEFSGYYAAYDRTNKKWSQPLTKALLER